MLYKTLIQAEQLESLQRTAQERLVIFDCRFDLADPEAGKRAHAAARIPSAGYLHLDDDLSGPKSGRNGRHPLPDRDQLSATLAALGARDDSQIVAYDAAEGMFAARLWWLVRWLGHADVAVLDGGLAAWMKAGFQLDRATALPARLGNFASRTPGVATIDYQSLRHANGRYLILDARAPDRFRGENETLDPVSGHIPGASNRFFQKNLTRTKHFKTAEELRHAFEALLAGCPVTRLVSQCGSGVTACHNLLALEIAGLPGALLYPGSWSEWSAQPDAPLAQGNEQTKQT